MPPLPTYPLLLSHHLTHSFDLIMNAPLLPTPSFPFPVYKRHVGHSSVMVMNTGQCWETRRGTQRLTDIPNPRVWNSEAEWLATVPQLYYDILQRPIPPHYNSEQVWMSQWHETSTLSCTIGDDGCEYHEILNGPSVIIMDGNSGSLVPIFMDLATGTMYAEGRPFICFGLSPYQLAAAWRFEDGTYYRIL